MLKRKDPNNIKTLMKTVFFQNINGIVNDRITLIMIIIEMKMQR